MLDRTVLEELLLCTLQDARWQGKADILDARVFRSQLHVFVAAPPQSRRTEIDLICPPDCGVPVQLHGFERYGGTSDPNEVLEELLGMRSSVVRRDEPQALRFQNFLALIFPDGSAEEECSISIRPDEMNSEAALLIWTLARKFAQLTVAADDGRFTVTKDQEFFPDSASGDDLALKPLEYKTKPFGERLLALTEAIEHWKEVLIGAVDYTPDGGPAGAGAFQFSVSGLRQPPGETLMTWLRRIEGLPAELQAWRVGRGLPSQTTIGGGGTFLRYRGSDRGKSGDRWEILMPL